MSANRLDQLIGEWSPRLQKAFLDAVYAIRNRAQITRIAERLERGDVQGALEAVGIDAVQFRALDAALHQAFEDGGRWQIDRIPAPRQPDGYRLAIQFDVRNLRAEQWLRERSGKLIREVAADQRAMIQRALVAGMEAGENPRTVALDLVGRINKATGRREGGLIGLTTSQEAWVRRYAEELAAGDGAALSRTLRDKRFDAVVKKAIESGAPVSTDTRDKMVAAYKNRALRFRAEAIGRTEAIGALHRASMEAMEQAIEAGQVDAAAVTKRWHSAADNRVRDAHRSLNGKSIGFRDPGFGSPSGALLRYPGDPDAPAAEIVQCRCWMDLRIDHMRGLR